MWEKFSPKSTFFATYALWWHYAPFFAKNLRRWHTPTYPAFLGLRLVGYTLVYAVVNSRIDYCNTVLAGAPRTVTDNKLQRVLNAAAALESLPRPRSNTPRRTLLARRPPPGVVQAVSAVAVLGRGWRGGGLSPGFSQSLIFQRPIPESVVTGSAN